MQEAESQFKPIAERFSDLVVYGIELTINVNVEAAAENSLFPFINYSGSQFLMILSFLPKLLKGFTYTLKNFLDSS